jgi:hypothetical protein
MSHYYTGPYFGLPHGAARLDLTDLHTFARSGLSLFASNTREYRREIDAGLRRSDEGRH